MQGGAEVHKCFLATQLPFESVYVITPIFVRYISSVNLHTCLVVIHSSDVYMPGSYMYTCSELMYTWHSSTTHTEQIHNFWSSNITFYEFIQSITFLICQHFVVFANCDYIFSSN